MLNFGYLSAFLVNFINPITKTNKDFKGNVYKWVASLLGLIIFGYFLIKVYEVPIYITKIKTVQMNSKSDIGDGLNIRIVRDYDRSDKGLAMSGSPEISSRVRENKCLGGIFINGRFHYEPSSWSDSAKICDSIKDVAKIKMSQYGKKEIEDPQIVYISSIITNRQIFGILYDIQNEAHFIVENGGCEITYFDGKKQAIKEYQYKDFFLYKNRRSVYDNNGRLNEEYYVASREDTVLYIDYISQPYPYTKPNVIRTLEDISKIVEVIEIGYSYLDHSEYAGTWSRVNSLEIDYVGPAEFSEPLDPQPDKKTLSSIIYTDKDKIQKIGMNGLKYHVKFPDMENIQEARIFILSGLLTGIAAFFFRYSFFILRDIWKSLSIKKNKKIQIIIILLIILSIIIFLILLKQSHVEVLNIRK